MGSLGLSSLIDRLDYEKYSTAQLAGPPLTLFALAVLVLAATFATTGAPVPLGVEFIGGTEMRVVATDGAGDPAELTDAFPVEPASMRSVPADGSYVVTFKDTGHDARELEAAAEQAGYEVRTSSQIAPSFGGETQRLALLGLGMAFAGMCVVVFGMFRTVVPSMAVIASTVPNLVVPLAVMAFVGVELSLGTVAALLMLIGYSVDSDVLLNDYVLRRSGEFYESVYAAMETGVDMTLTSLLAVVVLAISAAILGMGLLRDFGFVLAIGLAVDLVNTYMLNVSLLRWYKFEGIKYL